MASTHDKECYRRARVKELYEDMRLATPLLPLANCGKAPRRLSRREMHWARNRPWPIKIAVAFPPPDLREDFAESDFPVGDPVKIRHLIPGCGYLIPTPQAA